MKKLKILLIVIIMLFLILPVSVKASDRDLGDVFQVGEDFISDGSETDLNMVDDETVASINDIGRFLTAVGLVILVCATLIMGIKYMMATPNDKAKLKKQLIGLLIASLVIFFSYTIWSAIVNQMESINLG